MLGQECKAIAVSLLNHCYLYLQVVSGNYHYGDEASQLPINFTPFNYPPIQVLGAELAQIIETQRAIEAGGMDLVSAQHSAILDLRLVCTWTLRIASSSAEEHVAQ